MAKLNVELRKRGRASPDMPEDLAPAPTEGDAPCDDVDESAEEDEDDEDATSTDSRFHDLDDVRVPGSTQQRTLRAVIRSAVRVNLCTVDDTAPLGAAPTLGTAVSVFPLVVAGTVDSVRLPCDVIDLTNFTSK
jgi:hypothetical protein